ncbi:ABC transporter ATP-binding protein [Marininema halotolerans]|uniref:ABC-2 type transport system ATP-binding protein n=1 Tax=Marininema halotolerans TaxID=1155944 RepID=A0A1I6U306_9BACL|nr:ABC transporter ATP-binding protein [Marininema halotolerans]SFS95840.1 ABC-2 type transport system ATP-binding protein [Marininema halotolerans]
MLDIKHVTGGYSPQHPVIHDISFSVKPGEMVGLIGLNGAGKSTTIKEILGFLQPTSGTISVDGLTLKEDPDRFKRHLAYIPETPYLYPELTLREHLELTAMAYSLEESQWRPRMDSLLEEFQMTKRLEWYPTTFSKGMRQKVMILCAFLIQPKLLIVDEPFIGLDPLAIHSLLNHMITLKNQGTGILLCTHVLATAEKHADRFVLLREGQIALQGTLSEMQTQAGLPTASLDDLFVHVAKENGL